MYEEGGFIYYRCSGYMGCPKALVAARQGYEGLPPPKHMQDIYDAGHLAEDLAIKALEEYGLRIVGRQEEGILPITEKIRLISHRDGVMEKNGRWRIVEVKSQGQTQWDEFERYGWQSGLFPKYTWQCSGMMHYWEEPLTLIRFNRDTGEIKQHDIDEPFQTVDEIRFKILETEALARTGELPSTCANRMYPCPFYYLHDDEKVEKDEGEGLGLLAAQYDRALAEEKRARGKKETARKALRASLGLGKTVVGSGPDADAWVVNFYEQKNPPTWDIEAALEAGVDLSPFRKQTTGERLRVRRISDTA